MSEIAEQPSINKDLEIAKGFVESGIYAPDYLKNGNQADFERYKPKAVTECFMLINQGSEIGLLPQQALSNLYILNGKVAMTSGQMGAQAHKRGYRLVCLELTREICTYECTAPDGSVTKITYDWEDAKLAGLIGKDVWKKHPKAMLSARCRALIVRTACPEFANIYDADELESVSEPVRKRVAKGEVKLVTSKFADNNEVEKEKENGGELA